MIGTDCIGIVVNPTTIRSRPRRALIFVWILDKNLLGILIIDFLNSLFLFLQLNVIYGSFTFYVDVFYRSWMYVWVAWQVSYKKQQLSALREHLSSLLVFMLLVFFVVSVLLIFLVFCVFTFSVQCREVRYDFRIKTVFGSSLPLVVCRKLHVLFALFVFAFV